jgi:hypothetical protein
VRKSRKRLVNDIAVKEEDNKIELGVKMKLKRGKHEKF